MGAHVPSCVYMCYLSSFLKKKNMAAWQTVCKLNPAAFQTASPSPCCFPVCLRCCWVVRVDTNSLSCRHTQPDPAKMRPVTAVTIKLCYNWFTALFCLSVRREKVQVTVAVPASDKAYFAGLQALSRNERPGLIFSNQPKRIKYMY